jgi:hypothetical protein
MHSKKAVTGEQDISFNGRMVSMGPLVRMDFHIPSEGPNLSSSETSHQSDRHATVHSAHTQTRNQSAD